MLTKQALFRYIAPAMIQRGTHLKEWGNVGELMVYENDLNGMTEIETWVESSEYKTDYEVRVVLGRSDNILTSTCTCPYYEDNFVPCKHIAAVLLTYIDEESLSIGSGIKRKPVSVMSDTLVTNLLNTISQSKSADVIGQVKLRPIIEYARNNTLGVSFKVGSSDKHMYVVQSINAFCDMISNHESKKYGKNLEFIHCVEAFDTPSQKLVTFLLSLYNKNDNYLESKQDTFFNYNYYAYSGNVMHRQIDLKGRYLDEFFDIIEKNNIAFEPNFWELEATMPPIHSSIEKKDNGCILKCPELVYAKGNSYYYIVSDLEFKIYKTPITKNLGLILDLIHEGHGHGLFIAERDLPKFSKYIYPLLSTNTMVDNIEYDPYDYTIEPPKFEIYLDSPQNDVITCEIKAIYSNNTYNILNTSKDGNRDLDEERIIEQKVRQYFNSFDESNSLLTFHGNDEALYEFITVSIPAMQSLTTVFISDRLKHLTVRPMQKVNIGISVNHDLLQLDLVSLDLSLKELSDILSKYDRKKKFYRLKDGSFINVENSNFDELHTLTDTLSLKKKQIESGSIEVPKYRAMYLESLQKEQAYNLDYDNSFRHMIQKIETINQEDYEVPVDLNATLRTYQLNGMRWLCALRDNGFGGLLADEMGLGKTLQVIAMLGNWKNRKRTLIVCPASLVYNWSKEIDKFLPSLPHRMIQGTQEERKQLIETSQENEVLITSYHILQRDIELYENIKFSCEVIDEAQYIKNANTMNAQAVKAIQASFKLALTGTPIENRLSELWSIFDYMMPGFFYNYQTFKKRFETPIVRDNDDLMERELNQMITPFVLRRVKKDVLKDLPDKLEEIYYAPLEGEQKLLYDAEVQKIKLLLTKQTDQEFKENKIAILAELTRLRQLCCYPGLVYDNYQQNSTKTDIGIDLICNAIEGGHKILLFSQFTSMLSLLEERLKERNIDYYLLEGKTPKKKRAEMVESFQEDDVPLFLISLKAGGTGLNLTAADIVIHYDPWWNTAVENQASDRAHRIGQTNVVTVYKLIMKDTIEERILELQSQKSDLANRVLSGDGISSSQLTREDLLALL